MAIAEGPIPPGPTTSLEDFGWITVHIGASDIAITGIRPQYMTYSRLIPLETSEEYITRLVCSISESARELGISIVGGHTGFYGAVTVPSSGGITVWGLGQEYITPADARVDDAVLITKGVAIEAVALLAAACGGVHAMHDATEGGLARGLWEMVQASSVGLRIQCSAVLVPPDVRSICHHFQLNPYEVISDGTLVLTVKPEMVEIVLTAHELAGLPAAVIGQVVF